MIFKQVMQSSSLMVVLVLYIGLVQTTDWNEGNKEGHEEVHQARTHQDNEADGTYWIPVVAEERQDLDTAATGHHHGRVQIKVYRGPTMHGHHEHFAPHGYWVKQPADDDHH